MHLAKRIYTYTDIDNLPPGSYEIIDGKRLSMSPAGFQHGLLEARFARFLDEHLPQEGWASVGEVGIILRRYPLRLRAADVVYVSKQTSPERPVKILEFPPDLVVEILSQENDVAYVNEKTQDYIKFGIPWIVLVDPDNEIVKVHQPGQAFPRQYTFADEFEIMNGLRLCVNELLK